jgi:hypothetical protein
VEIGQGRPEESVFFEQSQLRSDDVGVQVAEGDRVPLPFEMQQVCVQLDRVVGDDQVCGKVSSTSWRDVNSAGSLTQMFFRLDTVETGDGHRLDGGEVDQVPVVEQLIDDLTGLVYLEFTEFLDGIEVLGVEGPKAGSVEI